MHQYRIKAYAPPHFINGRIVGAGEVVTLPDGVTAGAWLEPLDAPADSAKSTKQKGRAAAPTVPAEPDTTAEKAEGEF